MTNYAPLMTRPEENEHVTVYLDPAEAMKFALRIRNVSFFIRSAVDLVTEFDENGKPKRVYDGVARAIPVSAKVARDMLRDLAGFNERKASVHQAVGQVEVARYGDCIFFG